MFTAPSLHSLALLLYVSLATGMVYFSVVVLHGALPLPSYQAKAQAVFALTLPVLVRNSLTRPHTRAAQKREPQPSIAEGEQHFTPPMAQSHVVVCGSTACVACIAASDAKYEVGCFLRRQTAHMEVCWRLLMVPYDRSFA